MNPLQFPDASVHSLRTVSVSKGLDLEVRKTHLLRQKSGYREIYMLGTHGNLDLTIKPRILRPNDRYFTVKVSVDILLTIFL